MEVEDAFRKRARVSGAVGGCSAGGPDRLSSLPDCLLHTIMSFLKSRQVVQTCVLSTRWMHLWRSAPCLDIDFDEFNKKAPTPVSKPIFFSDTVIHLLLAEDHGACVLVIMAPALGYLHLAMHVGNFSHGVSLNEVPSIAKALIHLKGHRYSFVTSKLGGDQFKLRYSISNSTNLELSGVGTEVLGKEPRVQEFKNLRNLLLDDCDLSDDFKTLVFFLQSSPILEKLSCEFPEYSNIMKGTPILNKISSSELNELDFLCENLKVEIIYKYGYGSHLIRLLQLVFLNLSKNNIKLTKYMAWAQWAQSYIKDIEWETFEDFADSLMHHCNLAMLDSLRLRVSKVRAPSFASRQAGGWLRRAMKYCSPDPPRQREGLVSTNSWRLKRLYLCNVALGMRFRDHVRSVFQSLEDCSCAIEAITSNSLKSLVLKNCRWRFLFQIISPTLKSLAITGGSNHPDFPLYIMAPAIAHLCLDVPSRFANRVAVS